MRTRRGFIGAATASAVLPALGSGRAAHGADRPPVPHLTVHDSDFAEALAFSEEGRRLGMTAYAIRGDVTRLWLQHLSPLWREQPRPVAGLTRQGALFCLERMAWDAGMRVVLQVDHARAEGAPARHVAFGAGSQGAAIEAALHAAGEDYGRVAARLLARWQARQAVIWRTGAAAEAGGAEPLVSWMIAPAGGA